MLGRTTVVDTVHGLRVLKTSHPPTYYLPVAGFRAGSLRPASGRSVCEWKGVARTTTWSAEAAGSPPRAAWGYDDPDPGYAAPVGHVAAYRAAMDSCTVDGEPVTAQPGGFYGGWVTSKVVGPFKGEPGRIGAGAA